MSEPTIDEVIDFLHEGYQYFTFYPNQAKIKLAIHALEERKNATSLAQNILFRMRPEWAQGPDLIFLLDNILRAMDEELQDGQKKETKTTERTFEYKTHEGTEKTTITKAIAILNLELRQCVTMRRQAVIDLAIRALQEMRERENDPNRDWTFNPKANGFYKLVAGGKIYVKTYGQPISTELPIPKPRTWRDVTAGELLDFINTLPGDQVPMWTIKIQQWAKDLIDFKHPHKYPPIGHEWR